MKLFCENTQRVHIKLRVHQLLEVNCDRLSTVRSLHITKMEINMRFYLSFDLNWHF